MCEMCEMCENEMHSEMGKSQNVIIFKVMLIIGLILNIAKKAF